MIWENILDQAGFLENTLIRRRLAGEKTIGRLSGYGSFPEWRGEQSLSRDDFLCWGKSSCFKTHKPEDAYHTVLQTASLISCFI